MSKKYPGGVLSKTVSVPTGPFETGVASGMWTMEDVVRFKQQGVWPTAGNAVPYIEDMFSCFLYTGNGSTQTITNGIDLAGEGGLVWIKVRDHTWENILTDTVRGATIEVVSNATYANITNTDDLTSFTSSGFSVGNGNAVNQGSPVRNYVSWTFRKQPKFFDVVTYTGTGSNTTIAHSLGSVPGSIIIKRTDTTSNWAVYHRSLANTQYLVLNSTAAAATGATWWNSTTPTSAVFSLGTDASVNASGGTYVAYIYAHDAGGFGLSGTDNVISCGSYVGSSNTPQQITLGYEPQWVLLKKSSTTDSWRVFDNMRGMALSTGGNAFLQPNTSDAEEASSNWILPNATGFVAGSSATDSATYIYIAIRRGPMKVPTLGTSVFSPVAYTGNGSTRTYSVGFPTDLSINMNRPDAGDAPTWNDRLRGSGLDLYSNSTQAEAVTGSAGVQFDNQTNIVVPSYRITNATTYIDWCMRRAPSFFDEVCYTGLRAINNTTPQVVSHNLGVVPELVIFKCRSAATISFTATNWATSTILGGVYSNAGYLNTNDSFGFSSNLNPADGGGVSASSITIGYGAAQTNATGNTYVAYLFATCAGVSKVGSYTGTGALQTVNCGFTGGARFVLIKRTDSTGNWWVYDSARGITSGNDPYLYLNTAAAEVTNTNYVDTDSTGFKVTAAAPAELNANGGTYIFLAIA